MRHRERLATVTAQSGRRQELLPPPPPPSHSHRRSPAGGSALRRCFSLLGSFEADWTENYQLDRVFYPMAAAMMGCHSLKLAGRGLSAAANAHHAAFFCLLLLAAVLTRCAPALYRRRSAWLRLLLLVYGYGMPFFGSPHVLDPPITRPSAVPLVGPLLDAAYLWMCTRGTFLGFLCVGARPPLYLAAPFQLLGVWRAMGVGYCSSEVLRHLVMQRRTDLALSSVALLFETALGTPLTSLVASASPYQRCQALLLFCYLAFSGVLPILLLVHILERGGSSSGSRSGSSAAGASGDEGSSSSRGDGSRSTEGSGEPQPTATARLELRLERWLSVLLWQPIPPPAPAPAPAAQPAVQPAALPTRRVRLTLPALAARWAVLLLLLWVLSCALCL